MEDDDDNEVEIAAFVFISDISDISNEVDINVYDICTLYIPK